jgi:hypothetical protein
MNDGTGVTFQSMEEIARRLAPKPPMSKDKTLRDYFAACAIPALIARGMYGYTDLAMHAYAMADALLAAREVQP